MKFACTGCGVCCKKLNKILDNFETIQDPFIKKEALKFPFKTNEDGSCEKLIDNKCSVYNKRPRLCNVSAMHQKYYRKLGITEKEFHNGQAKACNHLQLEANIDPKFTVKFI